MKNGWRMKEIDEMDMLGFLRLRAWDATREQEKKKPRQRFIDESVARGETGMMQIDKLEFRVSKQESLLRLLSRPFP